MGYANLTLYNDTPLWDKLYKEWKGSGVRFVSFFKSIDNNIIDVYDYDGYKIIITFESEAHLTWFLLKWS
jgi:hypothetical protein